MGKKKAVEKKVVKELKIDLGCGPNKREGFLGVDAMQFDGKVDLVFDLRKKWPWKNDSVDELNASHFLEHLTWPERIHFFNEAFRVMKKGAKGTIIIPHWCSSRYYGDPTHQAPMSEFGFYYVKEEWRKANAPHTGYKCDFDATWGYSIHPGLQGRNQEFVQDKLSWAKEAAQDLMVTITRR